MTEKNHTGDVAQPTQDLFNRIATITVDDQGHRNSELQQVLVAGYVALKWALPLQGAAETIAAIAALVKSASAPCSSQNTAESSPPVMSGDAEADTQCSAATDYANGLKSLSGLVTLTPEQSDFLHDAAQEFERLRAAPQTPREPGK
ncbi:hypothetical protein [Bradyrhizobium tunisiense]|uniref:hypothetical protein n=1 Tax=Bradyrhizobium tunisiense TaxID=3278709 RepID=UPI0035D7D6B7